MLPLVMANDEEVVQNLLACQPGLDLCTECLAEPVPEPDIIRQMLRLLFPTAVQVIHREIAWQLTDRDGHFRSESSVYRILRAHDLITSPAYVVLSAATRFPHSTHRPNELWQTDFTYLPVVGWGWYYLSTVLDDYSRFILAWLVRTSMQARDVTETLDLARARTGVDRVQVVHRPRLLRDNGPACLSGALAATLRVRWN